MDQPLREPRTSISDDPTDNLLLDRGRSGIHPYLPLPSVYDESLSSPSSHKYYITNNRNKIPWQAIILAILYYILAVILPIFNDAIFRGYGNIKGYPFPLTATWLQLIGVTLCLLFTNLIVHGFVQRNDVLQKSWVFGEGFLWKCQHLFFPSLAFALVMSLTNMGLFLIKDVNIHVLLRASEIIWVVLFAFIVQKELPTVLTLLCCLLLILGTGFVSLDFSGSMTYKIATIVAIIINLLSSMASGLMLVLLRRACLILRKKDPTTSILEITLIKVAMATIMLTPVTLAMEINAWSALLQAEIQIQLLVGAGVFITMAYQSIVVGLTAFSLATTVGIIAQSKIIPQIILSIVWLRKFIPTPLHVVGALMLVIGSCAYGLLRWFAHKKEMENRLYRSFIVDNNSYQ